MMATKQTLLAVVLVVVSTVIVCIALCGGGWWFFIYSHESKAYARYRQEIEALKVEIDQRKALYEKAMDAGDKEEALKLNDEMDARLPKLIGAMQFFIINTDELDRVQYVYEFTTYRRLEAQLLYDRLKRLGG